MGFLDRFLSVPGASGTSRQFAAPGADAKGKHLDRSIYAKAMGLRGLSSFEEGPLVQIPGIPRPTGRAPVNPDVVNRIQIPRDARGTTKTLELMAELAIEASQDPGFVQFAREIVRGCPPRDYVCEGDAILQHVHETVPYLNDPSALEYVQSPGWTYLVEGRGDCDDAATLIAAFDVSIGRPCRFAAYRLDRERPDEFSHVQCQIGIPGRNGRLEWFGQDSIVADPRLGWEPPRNEWVGPPNYVVVMGG